MKLGLAVLPLEVWADVFETPCITRQWLAYLADNNGNYCFTEKLQKLLHECGKHSLRYLQIYSKPAANAKPITNTECQYQLRKRKIVQPKCQASLEVAAHATRNLWCLVINKSSYKSIDFPETEMPENITKFKRISIGHLDDQVLDFLTKIKPLLNNVFLDMKHFKSLANMRTVFGHLFPMIGSIRGITFNHISLDVLGQHFPDILAIAKELLISNPPTPSSLTAYLGWLSAPHNFDQHGPRFLKLSARSRSGAIPGIVNAVSEQFMAATAPSAAFVFFLQFMWDADYKRANEQELQNAATKEQLTVRNAVCSKGPAPSYQDIHYVEILRHPIGAEAKMREWIEQRAYYAPKRQNTTSDYNEVVQVIHITANPTIGHITNEADAVDQDGNEGQSADEAGPSTSAKRIKKK